MVINSTYQRKIPEQKKIFSHIVSLGSKIRVSDEENYIVVRCKANSHYSHVPLAVFCEKR